MLTKELLALKNKEFKEGYEAGSRDFNEGYKMRRAEEMANEVSFEYFKGYYEGFYDARELKEQVVYTE